MEFPPHVYATSPPTSYYLNSDSPFRSKLEPEIQLHYESGGSGQNSDHEMDGVTGQQGPPNPPPPPPPSYPGNQDITPLRNNSSLNRTDINIAIDESYCVVENGQQKWKCNLCPKIYTTKHNLVTHVLGHVGVRPYVCTICNKAFKQMGHLNAHRQTHEGNKTHQCPICKRSFLRLIYVKRHMITHANRKPYMCHICPEGFVHPAELDVHMDKHKLLPGLLSDGYPPHPHHQSLNSASRDNNNHQHHGGNNSITGNNSNGNNNNKKQGDLRCEVCGRLFLYPSQLKDHMLSHAQVRPYRCEVCGMRFIKDHHLKAHQLTHTDERPHKCPICGRGFSLKGNMIRHTLVHQQERNFACDVCGKKFSQPQTLKMHMVVHAVQKPFSCDICGKALARAHNLRSHMALHRNVKPHQCHLCGSAFTMKGNLQRHFKEKHKDAIPPPQLSLLSPIYPLSNPQLPPPSLQSQEGLGNHCLNGQASGSAYGHETDYLSGKRRKTSPKKLHAKKRKGGQHMPKRNLCPPIMTSNGPYLSIPCSLPGDIDKNGCPRSCIPTPAPVVSHHFHSLEPPRTGEDIMGKIKALHTAIDDLAGKCGQPPEKVNPIHNAIDEMAGKPDYPSGEHHPNEQCSS